MDLMHIYARKKDEIAHIERALEQSVKSDHAMLNETSLHLLKAGGKRLRPVFVLLAGEFGDGDLERLTNVAVPLELIHMASLVHDDVIDDAQTRRGRSTVKSRWDNRIAMYTGDYIFAKALSVITRLEDPHIHRILSRSIVQMCIGEMEQIRYFYHTGQSVREYLLRIRRKTALLIAVSCQLGAMASNAPEWISRAMYRYGYNVGMAFQIRDDILDLIGTEEVLGKPPGSDIRQGNITLPIIYALQDDRLHAKLVVLISQIERAEGKTDISRFLEIIHRSDGIDRSEKLADCYIKKAIRSLADIPDGQTKQSLIDIAYFVGSRNY